MIKLKAILHQATFYGDGSAKLILEVAESEAMSVAKLTALKECVLDISIEKEDKK